MTGFTITSSEIKSDINMDKKMLRFLLQTKILQKSVTNEREFSIANSELNSDLNINKTCEDFD